MTVYLFFYLYFTLIQWNLVARYLDNNRDVLFNGTIQMKQNFLNIVVSVIMYLHVDNGEI